MSADKAVSIMNKKKVKPYSKSEIEAAFDGSGNTLGNFSLTKSDSYFWSISDANNSFTQYKMCSRCFMIISVGGQLSRHEMFTCRRRNNNEHRTSQLITDFVETFKLSSHQTEKLSTHIADYLVAEGRPVTHVESKNFRKLLSAAILLTKNVEQNDIQLPGRKAIQSYCEKASENLFSKYGEIIKKNADQERVSIQLDFGKCNGIDYMVVFANFIEEDNDSWKYKTIPMGFKTVYDGKSSERIYDMVVEVAKDMRIGEETINKCYVTGDGASNIKKFATNLMGGYIRCVNHALNIIAERTLKPYHNSLHSFTEQEKKKLLEMQEAIAKCSNVIVYIRSRAELKRTLPFIPRMPISTRWLFTYDSVEDILKLGNELISVMDGSPKDISDKILWIKANSKMLENILIILKPIKERIKLFETIETSMIHHVAPTYYILLHSYEALCREYEDDTLLCKTAKQAISTHIRDHLSEEHYAASFLNFGTRKMKLFPEDVKEKTIAFVKDQLKSMNMTPSQKQAIRSPPRKQSLLYVDSSSDEEEENTIIEDEIRNYRIMTFDIDKENSSPGVFWTKVRHMFPLLYEYSIRLFGSCCSESHCERAFSTVGHIMDKTRNNLKDHNFERIILSKLMAYLE